MATTEEEVNSSTSADNATVEKVLCSPCDADGKKLESVGYCVNCKEHLCSTCFKYHRLPSLLRRHVLIDQGEMGSVPGRLNSCPEHERRSVEYHLKTCKDSLHIPEVAGTFTNSEDFKAFTTNLDRVATKANTMILNAIRSTKSVEKHTAEEIAAVKAYTVQVVEDAERLENDLIGKLERAEETETTNWKTVIDKCSTIREESIAISAEVEILQNKSRNADLYVTMVKSKDKLTSLENEIIALENDGSFNRSTFKGNVELLDLLNNQQGLGKLVNSGTIDSVRHVRDINVKTGEDSRDCCIRGSAVMLDGLLVIGDTSNDKVMLVDTKDNQVVSEMKLSRAPWSVTAVTASTVAVTLPGDKKIVFVRTTPALSVDREVSTKGECHGVAYCEGKLVVTYRRENKVVVLDMKGTVLREMQTDARGKALFANPYTAAVDPRHERIYVSNTRGGSYVLCLKLDGTVVATYKDNELICPQQAAVDSNGMVFVCAYNSKNLHLLTPDCKKVKVLLSSIDGLENPETMSYDETRQNLYVSVGNNIKVFRIEYTAL